MIEYLDQLVEAGVSSFKIEGRAKSFYYVATITNAYRCAVDLLKKIQPITAYLVGCWKRRRKSAIGSIAQDFILAAPKWPVL